MRASFVVAAVVSSGCSGKEIGRIPFTKAGDGETKVIIDGAKDTELWVKSEVSNCEPGLNTSFDVELFQNGQSIRTAKCNLSSLLPNNGASDSDTTRGGSSFARCQRLGKLPAGETVVKASFSFTGQTCLVLRQASLVVTQK